MPSASISASSELPLPSARELLLRERIVYLQQRAADLEAEIARLQEIIVVIRGLMR